MTANEREYRITKAAAKKFEEALKNFDERPAAHRGAHPRLIRAEKEGIARGACHVAAGVARVRAAAFGARADQLAGS